MTNTRYDNLYTIQDDISNGVVHFQDWHDDRLTMNMLSNDGVLELSYLQVLDMIDAMQKYMRGVIEKMRGLQILVPVGYFGLPDEFHGTIGEITSNGKVEVVILDENNEIDGINIETMRTVIEWREAWINEHGE